MTNEYSLQDLFLNKHIGYKETFILIKGAFFGKDAFQRLKSMLTADNQNIFVPCLDCEREIPFSYKVARMSDENDVDPRNTSIILGWERSSVCNDLCIGFKIDGEESSFYHEKPTEFESFKPSDYLKYICYHFTCSKNPEHHYEMLLSIMVKDGSVTVTKIGQTPLPYQLISGPSAQYERLLEKFDAKQDFRNAKRAQSEGLYIGALIYLRRVFEKMIDYANKEAGNEGHEGDKMEDRIRLAKAYIEPRVYSKMNGLWQLVSENIHNRDEKRAEEDYRHVEALLTFQLHFMKTEKEKDRMLEEAFAIIDKDQRERKKR